MKIIKNISWALIGIYYTLNFARAVVPHMVQADLSYVVAVLLSQIVVYFSLFIVIIIVFNLVAIYLAYKRNLVKPSLVFISTLLLLSILPIKFSSQFIYLNFLGAKALTEKSSLVMHEIPSTINTYLYTPNQETEKLIENDFESYFVEASKDGSSFVKIYKKRGEKIENLGGGYSFESKMVTYPASYIQFYGTAVNDSGSVMDQNGSLVKDTRDKGVRNCRSPASILNFKEDWQIDKVFEQTINDARVSLYQLKEQKYYRLNILKGEACSVIDFSETPDSYSVAKIIEISKSLLIK